MLKTKIRISLLPLLIFVASCSSNNDGKANANSSTPVLIGDYLASNDSYSKLREALEVTQLSDAVFEPGLMMLFAPTDEAFDKIDPLTLELLFSQAELSKDGSGTLKNILMYHLINGLDANSEDITAEIQNSGDNIFVTPNTTLGLPLEISQSEDNLVISGKNGSATIVQADVKSINGMIHSIDTILNPTDLIFPSPAVDESAVEEATDDVEEGAEDVEEGAEDAADKTEEELERAGEDIEEEADRVQEDIKSIFE
jgi:uncharacterized surface protein with fasciclin (FAS1) repeats